MKVYLLKYIGYQQIDKISTFARCMRARLYVLITIQFNATLFFAFLASFQLEMEHTSYGLYHRQ